jgi:superfamily II DNA or RNA helicase
LRACDTVRRKSTEYRRFPAFAAIVPCGSCTLAAFTAMQNPPRIGDIVHARRRRWRVTDVRAYPACALVTLDASHTDSLRSTLRVLVPFDKLEPARDSIRLVRVDRARWLRRVVHLSSAQNDVDSLHSAPKANLELFAFQLEPITALLRGGARRLLIADDVGLGKTVQAGLTATELLARGLVDRVLVLAPAGLREQWVSELASRFALGFALLDMRSVEARRSQLPAHVNPWSTEARVVASIDYVKRPEILPSVAECRWDLVIVDEAHGSAAGDRYEAAARLCSTAGIVLLLTATPHSGDGGAFDRLCAIGSAGDPLLFFRRTRADVGLPQNRRAHQLRVRSTAAEQAMHTLLERFADAVRREHEPHGDSALALSVLRKRGMSSASSLARTVRRRLDQLAADRPAPDRQIALDFGDPGGEHDADQEPEWTCPGLGDAASERRLLTAVADAAVRAAAHESKVRALRRLLARIREPVLVFTEYRDTLLHLRETAAPRATILHGGLSRVERAAAVAAFTDGGAAVLLATDAAGEGLNLHRRCRVVINFELPWNPVRLEQRTGRVDRIGQQRRVHTFHLVAFDAGERAVADRLDTRRARADEGLRAMSTVRVDVSREMARLRVIRRERDVPSRGAPGVTGVDSGRDSVAETSAVGVCIGGRPAWRAAFGCAAIVLMRLQLLDQSGRTVAARVMPLRVALSPGGRIRSRAEIRRLIASLQSFAPRAHDASFGEWVQTNVSVSDAFWNSCRLREQAILERLAVRRQTYRQQSLFTQRVDADDAERRTRSLAAAELQLTIAEHRRSLTVSAAPVLILLP